MFDIWTFSNSITFIAIIIHYINSNKKLQTINISRLQVIGSYSGDVIGEQVVQVIQKYKFEKKFGYFVLDNTTSSNTCVKAILAKMWPALTQEERKFWCMSNIINLATQAFLYKKKKVVFTIKVYGVAGNLDIKKQLEF